MLCKCDLITEKIYAKMQNEETIDDEEAKVCAKFL